MKTNIGRIDRTLRITGGLALISLALLGIISAWGYLGLLPLLSGVWGYCPAYAVLGVSTCRVDRRRLDS